MISIRLWLEVPTPSGKGMQRLPVLPGELMVPGISEIVTAVVEEINVDGKSHEMQAVRDAFAGGTIRLRLFGAPNNLTDSTFVSLIVDIVEQPGQQPGE